MSKKVPVTQRLVEAMRDASQSMPRNTPGDDDAAWLAEAIAARRFLGAHLREYATALTNACANARHRGSKPATDSHPGTPCLACARKVKNMREAAEIIEPDRSSD